MFGFIWSEMGSHWRVLSREGRGFIFKISLVIVRTLDCGEARMETRRQVKRPQQGTDTCTAGMVTMELGRGGWIPGILWIWEVREGEVSKMTLWALGGWMVLFSQPENPGEDQWHTENSRAPL